MYLEMAEEEDKKLAESWKADAEGILVFVRLCPFVPCITSTNRPQTGLFSAAVASLITVSIQGLQQKPQDTSNFYLANIYQLLADPNRPNISSSLPTSLPPFFPPTFAVWVNSLWFLSLVISITCALLATLLQQWARRYLRVTQPRYSLHKRARIRSFFAEGVEKSLLPLAVEALPTLLHVSVFLFFSGLVIFLWNVNLTIFKVVLSWVGFCIAVYGCITLIPIVRRDSPYYTPLTQLAGLVIVAIGYMFHFLFFCISVLSLCCSSACSCYLGPTRVFGHLTNWLLDVVEETYETSMKPEKAALMSPSEIDTRALMWTFDRLDEDHELEAFFSGLHDFQNSKALKQPLHGLNNDQKLKLATAMIGLLDRTFSTDLLSDQVKNYRADICANTIKLVDSPKAFPEILRRLASEDSYGPMQSTKVVHFIRRWDDRKDDEDSTVVQAIFSVVVARVQQRDDSWFILASSELGVSEAVLREHAAYGNSLSFVILIYIIRQQLDHFGNMSWPSPEVSKVLGSASIFDVQNTSLTLQHEFCALWNQVVRKAQGDEDWKIANHILRPIRKVYIILHQGTDCAPTRFSASTSEDDYILMEQSAYPLCNVPGHIHADSASTILCHTTRNDKTMLLPASLTGPDVPSSSTLDRPIVTPKFSPSIPLPTSAFPQGAVPLLQHFADSSTSSNVPSLPSVFANTLPTGSPSPSDFRVTLFDHRSLTPDLHSSILACAPQLTAVPDLGAAPEREDGAVAAFQDKEDALYPLSALSKDIIATSGLPQSSSVTDTAIVGLSRRSLGDEDTRDDPPHPSHGQYNIV